MLPGLERRNSYLNILSFYFFSSHLREEEDVFVNELLHFLTRVVIVLKVSKSLNFQALMDLSPLTTIKSANWGCFAQAESWFAWTDSQFAQTKDMLVNVLPIFDRANRFLGETMGKIYSMIQYTRHVFKPKTTERNQPKQNNLKNQNHWKDWKETA